ncbi:hypothetical protein J4G37_42720, partial [Microvirga sp. 3-52]|nr:hypothetical protein [Microvirga sp. 3-52]
LIVIVFGILFYSKVYYPTLPIDSVSKREVVNKGNSANEKIIKLAEEKGYEWYISKINQGNANEQLKQMMESKGWTFKEQMGAGFFFEKDNEEIIVESEMWTGKYVIFRMPKAH